MPAASTHTEFARDVYFSLPAEEQKKITDFPMYYIGSQGPDLLFFSRFSYLPGSLKKYGTRMHGDKVREVIRFFKEYAKDDPALNSYIAGYLCHYALDSQAHPLIDWAARVNHETTGIHQGEAHISSEADIDLAVLKKHGRNMDGYNVYTDLKASPESKEKLALMYQAMLKEVFDVPVSLNDTREAVTGICRITKLLRPTAGWKYKAVYKAENLAGIPHVVSGMMLNKPDHDILVLNEEHRDYDSPSRGVIGHRSFMEIYDDAMIFAAELITDFSEDDLQYDFAGDPIR